MSYTSLDVEEIYHHSLSSIKSNAVSVYISFTSTKKWKPDFVRSFPRLVSPTQICVILFPPSCIIALSSRECEWGVTSGGRSGVLDIVSSTSWAVRLCWSGVSCRDFSGGSEVRNVLEVILDKELLTDINNSWFARLIDCVLLSSKLRIMAQKYWNV